MPTERVTKYSFLNKDGERGRERRGGGGDWKKSFYRPEVFSISLHHKVGYFLLISLLTSSELTLLLSLQNTNATESYLPSFFYPA